MKTIHKTLVLFTLFIVCGLLIYATSYQNISKNNYQEYPLDIDFCGEKVPTDLADVKERLDREMLVNINMNASTAILIKRANKVFPIIEPILAKNGIPDDFKYLAVIESGLINAVSPAGARGVWQFMPATAKESKLEVTDQVDERYHIEKATQAACEYLLKAKNKLGNWTVAAASYNGGMAGLQNHINYQQSSNYYDLWLTDETARYVFRILALKEIMKNPEKYGYNIPREALYPKINTKRITVDSTITNLSAFAISQGINYKILKTHNQWLRDKRLDNPTKKVYEIEIPTEGYKSE
ncbi:lytic transglycosylase domain-containing protein [Flavobacterium difficile]|uniref:Lytic transglycosylase domain-containing protein n=1 Tax=Flavobacterium difficile TaxID=2709659 RepID=A0ABX0I4H8_9FLAO|nr:lytic transglycosylase domain-containing protein [Flavobacterium difficile]NHM01631.1 lytic transglycosylase domain-containing protein [Flavobacterium difficile]